MGDLILALVPLAAGIVISPLAIMALVAVLLSARARINGVMYLIGWALGLTCVLVLGFTVLGGLKPAQSPTTPSWMSAVHILLGLVLIAGAVWSYRKGRTVLRQMAAATTPAEVVAAAPQLPGWLKAVATFTAVRSLLLGFGIFALNPVDFSCALIAGMDIGSAHLPPGTQLTVLMIFGIVGVLPIALPVVMILTTGDRADPVLNRVRDWIAGHNGMLSAGMLLVIGALQLQKGLGALLS
jgi:hypothetical protein